MMHSIDNRPNKNIRIGKIERIIIFGGGLLLVKLAREARQRGIDVHIFAVKRHLEEVVDGQNTFQQLLDKENISYYPAKDINQLPQLKELVNDRTMGIGIGETYTFNTETINLFKDKLFDFMVIKLPQYRGGAHFTWQILREDKTGAWNVQVINEEMVPGVYDSGEIVKTRRYDIPESVRTPEDYFGISDEQGLELFKEFLDEIAQGKVFQLTRSNEAEGLYLPRLYTLRHAYINWDWTANELGRFINAFSDPYAGASTFLANKKVHLKDVSASSADGTFHPFISGLIYRIHDGSVFVAVKDGSLIIKKVLDEQGRDIAAELRIGQRLYTPAKYLEEAMLFNAEYNSEGITNAKAVQK
ncbi:hypothetical protein ACFL37_01375 [Candidatus Margulisiibacteriota bacterium]